MVPTLRGRLPERDDPRSPRQPVWRLVALAAVTCLLGLPPHLSGQDPVPLFDSASARGYADLDALMAALPPATPPTLDRTLSVWLASLPLSCVDQLQPAPSNRPYYWIATPRLVDDHDSNRAFWGCSDWHSAVSSMWVLVRLLKSSPHDDLDRLVREKLTSHLGKQNLEGELAFFRSEEAFERPYGYAWLLRLQGELATWPDSQAVEWTANVAPLASWMQQGLTAYLDELDEPVRNARQTNTAHVLSLALAYAEAVGDTRFRRRLVEAARSYFGGAEECATQREAGGAGGGRGRGGGGRGGRDVLSPCLAEAALMGEAMQPAEYARWLDGFLPPLQSERFAPLTRPFDGAEPASVSVLGFQRAEALERIAGRLPSTDPRVPVLRRLAAVHAKSALAAMRGEAEAASWLPAYALLYFLAAP